MSDLRKLAKGQRCLVRTPNCNNNPETTVLAHVRLVGISGMGLKSPDILGAWCCSQCHSFVDQQSNENRKERDLMLYQGMARTINELVKKGVIRWD